MRSRGDRAAAAAAAAAAVSAADPGCAFLLAMQLPASRDFGNSQPRSNQRTIRRDLHRQGEACLSEVLLESVLKGHACRHGARTCHGMHGVQTRAAVCPRGSTAVAIGVHTAVSRSPGVRACMRWGGDRLRSWSGLGAMPASGHGPVAADTTSADACISAAVASASTNTTCMAGMAACSTAAGACGSDAAAPPLTPPRLRLKSQARPPRGISARVEAALEWRWQASGGGSSMYPASISYHAMHPAGGSDACMLPPVCGCRQKCGGSTLQHPATTSCLE